MPSIRVSDCRVSEATRNENKPDSCEVKRDKGRRKEKMTIVECPKMQAPTCELWAGNRIKCNRNGPSLVSTTICLHGFT